MGNENRQTRSQIIAALVDNYTAGLDTLSDISAAVEELLIYGGPGYIHLENAELAEVYEEELGESVEVVDDA